MKREEEIDECKSLVTEEPTDHIHIRKKAIVGDFTDELQESLKEDANVISVDITEWDYDEVMETLRWELQKELSWIRYRVSRVVSFTLHTIGAERERKPDYERVNEYFDRVSKDVDKDLVLLVNHHGEKPVKDFRWISKLRELPENTTIITHGFQTCDRDGSKEFTVGRLNTQQTVDYLTDEVPSLTEDEAAEIHEIHDGNPVALKIALENDQLREPLGDENLEQLWSEVYDDILSSRERDLLYGSAHLVDLNSKDVALTVEKTRGECETILQNLRSKGVVSQKKSGLFTTDWYVKYYVTNDMRSDRIGENHRGAFKNYAEKWVHDYESRMENSFVENDQNDLAPTSSQKELMNVDMYLAAHHLANAYSNIDKEIFISQLEDVDAPDSGIFSFGVILQRFFFEDPVEVIEELSESLLGVEDETENTLLSGTIGILLDFDLRWYVDQLSGGWSENITTNELPTGTASDPTAVRERIQNNLDIKILNNAPQDVRFAIANFIAVLYADDRTANEYYRLFGKTAGKYGLNEGPYTECLEEVKVLIDLLDPDVDSQDENNQHPLEESLARLDKEIRSRIGLEELLEENRTKKQQGFQQHLEYIRDRPSQITDQYIKCGEKLEETENPLFPYLWYFLGDQFILKVILDQKSTEVYGKYMYWVAKREDYESDYDADELVVTTDDVEDILS